MAVTTFAAIDIGSYEISMKIFEFSKKIGFRELNDVRYRLEIGKGAYSRGRLEPEMVDDICVILKDFSNMMQEFGVSEYRACATSAFREIVNPVIVQEQIYQRTGIRIEILSNAEQHFLGYKSIAAIESGFKKIIQKGTAILDVGGGNLQVSLFDKDALVTTQSFKMGSMRIRERLKELEKTTTHYDQLIKEFIRNDLTAFQRLYLKDRDIKNVILMGDFLTDTIFREELGDHIITSDEFTKRYKTEQALAQEMDIDPEYASLVIPTMVICKNFLEIFQAESVWVPGVSLLDGIAYDYGEKKKFIKSVHNFENDILVASKNIAKRYSTGKDHIKGTTDIALTIFDSMKKVHGMGQRERLYLRLAAILHDCGKYISMINIGEASYDIIMATEMIGLSHMEREIVANVVRFNHSNFVYYGQAQDRPQGLDKESYLTVAKLTAILRLANSLDRSHKQKMKGVKAVLQDNELILKIDTQEDITLERGFFQTNTEFFKEVYSITPVIRQKKKF